MSDAPDPFVAALLRVTFCCLLFGPLLGTALAWRASAGSVVGDDEPDGFDAKNVVPLRKRK